MTWLDHAPISVTLQEKRATPPVFLWRKDTLLYTSSKRKFQLQKQLRIFFQLNSSPKTYEFTLWCSHKAFCRGQLLQLASMEKRWRSQALSAFLDKIKALEALLNRVLNELQKYRLDIRQLLLLPHKNSVKRFKAT